MENVENLNEFLFKKKTPEEIEEIKAKKAEKKLSKIKEKILSKFEGNGNPIVSAVEQQIGYYDSDNKKNRRAERFEALLRSKTTNIITNAKIQISKAKSIDEVNEIYRSCKNAISSKLAELISEEIKIVRSKELTLSEEIFLAKQEKKLNENVSSLIESLNISDDSEAGLLNLKYCQTAEILKEFNYDVFSKFKNEKDYESIKESNDIIKNAFNLIEQLEVTEVIKGYETLAKAKIVLESSDIKIDAKSFNEYLKESNQKNNFKNRLEKIKNVQRAGRMFLKNDIESKVKNQKQEAQPYIEQREDNI